MIHGGFSYRRTRANKNDNTREYWQCVEFKRLQCGSRGTSVNNRSSFERTSDHNHAADPVAVEKRDVKLDMKRKAGQALGGDTTTAVYQSALANCSEAAMATLSPAESLKRTILRARVRAQVPIPLPPNRDAIQVPIELQVITIIQNIVLGEKRHILLRW